MFECGPKCGCGPACVNRTSQRGLKYRFEVMLSLLLFFLVIWKQGHLITDLCQSGSCLKYEGSE